MIQYKFTFMPITENNLPSLQSMLYQWLHSPHVAQWWPVPKDNEEFLNSFIKRIRSGTKPYLISCNDVPMRYIQTYVVDRPGTAPYDKDLPENLIGIDQFIGELDYLHKGYGVLFIKQFIKNLLAEDATRTIILDPTATNLAAIRCYEKIGFQRMGEYDAPGGPALLMVYKSNDCMKTRHDL